MSERESVRSRMAPSPTGLPHLGNFRTLVSKWLLARHHGGQFVLRIEDTDVARKVEGAKDAFLDAMRRLQPDWTNSYYIRQIPVEDLTSRLMPFLRSAGLATESDRSYVEQPYS